MSGQPQTAVADDKTVEGTQNHGDETSKTSVNGFEIQSTKLDEEFRDCSFARTRSGRGFDPDPQGDGIQGISAIDGGLEQDNS